MEESKTPQVFSAALVLGTISFTVTALRVFTRVRIVKAWGADDVLIVVAELLAIAFLICLLIGTSNGMGSHIKTLSRQEILAFLKALWILNIVSASQTMFAKLSVLVFYRRVMGHHRWFKLATSAIIVFVILLGIQYELVLFCFCQPLQFFWNKTIPGGYCLDLELAHLINLVLNLITDLVITVLPFPILTKLELPRRQKFGLCAIFGLGGFVCAISIARVIELPHLSDSKDLTWDIASAMIWLYVEVTFIIVAACGPSLKPFFRRYIPAILGSITRGSTKDAPSYAVGESHDLKQFQRSASVTTGSRACFGEGESREHIIGEDSGILRTTNVVLTVEDIQVPHGPGSGRQGSETP
ncbi:hypothetical protein HOY80DRAFT_1031495 [Tuber brumale]|nr:hypothetical protein HOY80DRAFT_1031495 [Tuber brumale]